MFSFFRFSVFSVVFLGILVVVAQGVLRVHAESTLDADSIRESLLETELRDVDDVEVQEDIVADDALLEEDSIMSDDIVSELEDTVDGESEENISVDGEESAEGDDVETEIPFETDLQEEGRVLGVVESELSESFFKRKSPEVTVSSAITKKVRYKNGRAVVVVEGEVSEADIVRLQQELGVKVSVVLNGDESVLVVTSVQGDATPKLLENLYRYIHLPLVSVEPDVLLNRALLPNDADFSSEWGLKNEGAVYNGVSGLNGFDVGIEEVWDVFTGSGQTVVAVIDSGLRLDHPEFIGNLWDGTANCFDFDGDILECPNSGFDFLYSQKNVFTGLYDFLDLNPMDEETHGTAVSGIIAAVGNNGQGIAGMNWLAKLMALKVGSVELQYSSGPDTVGFFLVDIINALNVAVRNGATVINLSFETSIFSVGMESLLQFAADNGAVIVASAGNSALDLELSSEPNDVYPCEFDISTLICVGASSPAGGVAGFSNVGTGIVDIYAPGEHIYTTNAGQEDVYFENFEEVGFAVFDAYSDVGDTISTGTGSWGVSTAFDIDFDGDGFSEAIDFKGSTDTVLFTHPSRVYTSDEDSLLLLNSSLDLSSYSSAVLFFEAYCSVSDVLDGAGNPVDGLEVVLSGDGGITLDPIIAYNTDLLEDETLGYGVHNLSLVILPLHERYMVDDFRFGFRFFSNDDELVGEGCIIDDVTLRATGTPTYSFVSGTSFSAPFVSGLASLVFDYAPATSALDVTELLKRAVYEQDFFPSITSGPFLYAPQVFVLLPGPSLTNGALSYLLENGDVVSSSTVVRSDVAVSWIDEVGTGVVDFYTYQLDVEDVVETTDTSVSFVGLAAGMHDFTVFATNTFGVVGEALSFSFLVDDDVPEMLRITGVTTQNGALNAVNELEVVFGFEPVLENGRIFVLVDDLPVVGSPFSLVVGDTVLSALDFSGFADGELNMEFVFEDAVGFRSQPLDFRLIKDTVIAAPELSVVGGAVVSRIDAGSVSFEITNTSNEVLGLQDFTLRDAVGGVVSLAESSGVALNLPAGQVTIISGIRLSELAAGDIVLSVVVEDGAYNRVSGTLLFTLLAAEPSVVSVSSGRGGGQSIASSRVSTGSNSVAKRASKVLRDIRELVTSTEVVVPLRETEVVQELQPLTMRERKAEAMRKRRAMGRATKAIPVMVFADVDAVSSVGHAVSYLVQQGAVTGHANGNFAPEEPINRASAYALLLRLRHLTEPDEPIDVPFSDYDADAWFAPFLQVAWEQNIAKGFLDGEFKPNLGVRRSEMLAMMFQVLGIDVTTEKVVPFADEDVSAWYAPHFATAFRLGLYNTKDTIDPADFVSRGEFAEVLVRLVKVLE